MEHSRTGAVATPKKAPDVVSLAVALMVALVEIVVRRDFVRLDVGVLLDVDVDVDVVLVLVVVVLVVVLVVVALMRLV